MGPLKAARIDMRFPTKHLRTAHASPYSQLANFSKAMVDAQNNPVLF
jgi:hypothetical protein